MIAGGAMAGRRIGTITVCPNTILAFGAFMSLLFVFRLGALGALLFLCTGALLLLRRPLANMTAIWRDGWIVLLPLWSGLTILWSAHPELTLRYGIQLGLTTVIAIVIAHRLSPRTLLRTVFVALLLAAMASIVIGRARSDGGGYLGIYGSKNAFAQVMTLFVIASMALALGRDGTRRWRIAGVFSVPVGLILLTMANSVGWLIAAVLAVIAGFVFALMRRIHRRYRLLAVCLLVLAVLAAALIAWANQDAILAAILKTSGKDVTLTGRTYLWRVALSEIAAHPLGGQGYQAVWVVGEPLAESLWREFYIPTKTGFHFHNTWLSNAVEIGVVGAAIQAAIFLVALFTSLWRVLQVTRADTLFAAMLMVPLTVMSMVEVVGFQQFQMVTMLILIIAVQGRRHMASARSDQRRGRPLEAAHHRRWSTPVAAAPFAHDPS